MNILYTSVGFLEDVDALAMIQEWRARHHIVELMPHQQLTGYLRLDPASHLASVDAIVCNAEEDLASEYTFALTRALKVASDVQNLPGCCAMRDGRKWNSLPFIIINEDLRYYEAFEERKSTHAQVLRPCPHPDVLLEQIQNRVDRYMERVLDDYHDLGIIVHFDRGRAKIGPALRKKNLDKESTYYYGPADRRDHTGLVTVMRDSQGLQTDVQLLEHSSRRRSLA